MGVGELFFNFVHEYVCVGWCHFGAHGCALYLSVVFVEEIKVVPFENEL